MGEKAIRKCRHNPQNDQSVISRIFLYTFKRNRSNCFFICADCGAALTWPKLYSSVTVKTLLYLFSLLVSYWLCDLMMENSIGTFTAICGIFLILYATYKLLSVLVLTFGRWEEANTELNDKKQFAILDGENRILKTAIFMGINTAALNIQQFQIACMLLVLYGIGVVVLLIRKKWIGVVISLVFVVYSIASLLFMRPYSELFRMIDNVLLLITMILIFSGQKKGYL